MTRRPDPRRPAEPARPFHRRVYAVVRLVPCGRVVTYGQVAALLGAPRAARAVGRALRALPPAAVGSVPWHRVVNAAGRVSHREAGWPERQRQLLELEGLRFRGGRLDLARVRWEGPALRRPAPAQGGTGTCRRSRPPRPR